MVKPLRSKKSVLDTRSVTWKKGNEILYSDEVAYTAEPTRIVRYPNNTLVIYNVRFNDASDNYMCTILEKNNNIMITHRLVVTKHSNHKSLNRGIIRVTPSRKVEVKEGESLTLGCETPRQTEIKWFFKVKASLYFNCNYKKKKRKYIVMSRISKFIVYFCFM